MSAVRQHTLLILTAVLTTTLTVSTAYAEPATPTWVTTNLIPLYHDGSISWDNLYSALLYLDHADILSISDVNVYGDADRASCLNSYHVTTDFGSFCASSADLFGMLQNPQYSGMTYEFVAPEPEQAPITPAIHIHPEPEPEPEPPVETHFDYTDFAVTYHVPNESHHILFEIKMGFERWEYFNEEVEPAYTEDPDEAELIFHERTLDEETAGYHQPGNATSPARIVVDTGKFGFIFRDSVCEYGRYASDGESSRLAIDVLAHEIGHHFWIMHTSDRTNLMYGGSDPQPPAVDDFNTTILRIPPVLSPQNTWACVA